MMRRILAALLLVAFAGTAHAVDPTATAIVLDTHTSPTMPPGDSSVRNANTEFVTLAMAAALIPYAPLNSPAFTGTPTAPTPGSNINTTQIPTTAWVNAWYAPLASPSLTGSPTAPTQASNDNSTKLATTAYVTSAVASLSTRPLLSADRTYYVATTGNDSNDCLSAPSPCLTVNHALALVARLDINGKNVTIQVADGAYDQAISLTDGVGFVGGIPLVQGNCTTPTNVTFAPSTYHFAVFQITFATQIKIGCMYLHKGTGSDDNGFYISGGARVYIQGPMQFGNFNQFQMFANSHAELYLNANVVSIGTMQAVISAQNGGLFEVGSPITWTVSGISFSNAFAYVFALGVANIPKAGAGGITYSGAATGSRYNVQYNGMINTSGGDTLPGDSAGTAANGGVYF